MRHSMIEYRAAGENEKAPGNSLQLLLNAQPQLNVLYRKIRTVKFKKSKTLSCCKAHPLCTV